MKNLLAMTLVATLAFVGGCSDDSNKGSTSSSSSSGSSSSGAMAVCGDGKIAGDEACDDSNKLDGDGCNSACAKECSSLEFAGATQAVAAMSASLDTKSVTLAAWFRAPATTKDGVIVSKKGAPEGGHVTYQIGLAAGGLSTRLETDAGFLDLIDATVIADDKWHHTALTYDASTGVGMAYVDGKQVGTSTMGTGLMATDPMQPFVIGAAALDATFEGFFVGKVAYAAIFDRPLSAAEITDLTKGVYAASGALALYLTPEGMGTSSADAAGKGHTLTVPADGWATMDAPFCQ